MSSHSSAVRRALPAGVVLATAAAALAIGPLTPDHAGAQGTPEPQIGGTLTQVGVGGDPIDVLDPGRTYVFSDELAAMQRSLYGSAPGRSGTQVPDLAAAAPEISADARTVTVRLRGGVRFTPPVNREVTSSDVRYAMERGFGRSVGTQYARTYFSSIVGAPRTPGAIRPISGIETPDARTLVLRLSKPNGALVAAALSLPITAPVPQEYAARFDRRSTSTYEKHVVGTGPYMVRRDAAGRLVGRVKGKRLELVRNPNWDRATDYRPAYLDGYVAVTRALSPERATSRVLAGSGELTAAIPTPVLRRLVTQRSPRLTRTSPGFTNFLALNTSVGPLRNVNVRRAALAAFDRTAYRRIGAGPLDGPIATGMIPPGLPGYAEAGGTRQATSSFNRATRSLRVARRYMRAAGRQGLPVTRDGRYAGRTTLRYPTVQETALDRRYDAFVVRAFASIGLRLRVEKLKDYQQVGARCSRPSSRSAVCFGGWGKDFEDAQTVLDPIFNSANITRRDNYNLSQLRSSAVDRAMAAANRLPSGTARNRAWAGVNRRVMNLAPVIPLRWERGAVVTSKDVRIAKNDATGGIDLSFSSIAK